MAATSVGHKIIHFAIKSPAEVTAKAITLDAESKAHFILLTPQGEISVHLPLLGIHNVMNALAAAAASLAVNISLQTIKAGLENVVAEGRRVTEYIGHRQAHIIDDSYNGSLPSFQAALAVLAARTGKKNFGVC